MVSKDLKTAGYVISGLERRLMRNTVEVFFLRDDQFCEQYFQKHTVGNTSKKTTHKTGKYGNVK